MVSITCKGDQLTIHSILLDIIFGCELCDSLRKRKCLLPRNNNRIVVVEDEVFQCECSHDMRAIWFNVDSNSVAFVHCEFLTSETAETTECRPQPNGALEACGRCRSGKLIHRCNYFVMKRVAFLRLLVIIFLLLENSSGERV